MTFPYQRVSDFFEAEGDFQENLEYEATHVSAHDGSDAMVVSQDDERITLVNEDGFTWTDPLSDWVPLDEDEDEDEDPCCLLYRQTYLEDHEWGCPRRVAKDRA